MASTTTFSDSTLQGVVEAVVAEVKPERVYVFGSRARGDAGPDFDLDLLIVEQLPFGPQRPRWRELSRIRRALRPFRVAKDILVYSSDEVEYWRDSPNHVVGWCMAEGRLVYARS